MSVINTKHMEASMPSVDHETQQIITTYQQIYNLIFGYGIFILLTVVSFLVVLVVKPIILANSVEINPTINNATVSSLVQSGNTYIAKGITLLPKANTSPLEISILQGFVTVSPEVQMGYGALATQAGIILPISINLTSHTGEYSKEFFSSTGYSAEALDTFMQTTILTYPVKNIQATVYQYRQRSLDENERSTIMEARTNNTSQDILAPVLPSNEASTLPASMTLSSRFGLHCLGNITITNFFCYRNAEQFVSRIPYLSFDNKLTELSDIIRDIIPTPYKDKACGNLQYSFSKNPTTSREREFIFNQCGPSYVEAYHRIVDFATVNFELQGISNAKLYTDDDINIFKLLSLQQKIYHNTLQKNYDVGTIEVYLSFVQDLLTRRPNIDQIYKDIIYLYNNTYLQSSLTQIAILNGNTKAMLRLNDVVRNINEGTIQLQRAIQNKALLTYVDANQASANSQTNLVTFQDLFASKFTTFDSFIVTSQRVNNDALSAQVEGYFIVNSDEEERKVLFVGDYIFENENFILTYASFPQSPYLETSLNKLINEHTVEVDIPFVYEFIRNNSDSASIAVTICDIISTRITPLDCSSNEAIFDAGQIRIKMTFDGYRITSINTSDNTTTTRLREALNNVITRQSNIASIVAELIKSASATNATNPNDTPLTGSSVDTNQFIVMSKLKQFLDVTPKNVNLNNGKYIVEFSLRGIDFVAAVDIANNYKVFPWAIRQEEKIFRINNLSLNLTNASLTEINQFKTNPWAYIKKVDPATYESTYKE